MKVTQASTYRTLQTNIERNSQKLQDLYLQGSTGLKLNKASDNPSAIQPVLSARNQITLSERFLTTLGISSDKMAATDTSLATMENIFQRASELSINAVNSVLSQQDLGTLADEVKQLKTQMLDIANAQIDGKSIFAGYSVDQKPFVENPNYDPALYDEADSSTWSVLYTGDSNRTTLEIGEDEYLEVDLTGNELFLGMENSELQAGSTGLTGSTMKSTGPLVPGSAGDITIQNGTTTTTILGTDLAAYTGDNYAAHLASELGQTGSGLKTTVHPAITDLDLSSLSSLTPIDNTYALSITSDSDTITVTLDGITPGQEFSFANIATALNNISVPTPGSATSRTLANGVHYDISSGTLVLTGEASGADLDITSNVTDTVTSVVTTTPSTTHGTVDITTNSTNKVTLAGDTSALTGAGLTAGTVNGSITVDIFGVLTRLEESLRSGNINDPDGVGGSVQDAITKLDLAADQNRRKRSQLGVKAMRVDDAISQQEAALIDIRTTLSRYEDADVTETYNAIIQQETAWKAALSVTGKVSQISILDYI